MQRRQGWWRGRATLAPGSVHPAPPTAPPGANPSSAPYGSGFQPPPSLHQCCHGRCRHLQAPFSGAAPHPPTHPPPWSCAGPACPDWVSTRSPPSPPTPSPAIMRGRECATVADARAACAPPHVGSATYLFAVPRDVGVSGMSMVIDATCRGGVARFVNHSCAPCLEAAAVAATSHHPARVLLMSRRCGGRTYVRLPTVGVGGGKGGGLCVWRGGVSKSAVREKERGGQQRVLRPCALNNEAG